MTFVLLLDKAQPPRCRVCVYSRALCPDGPQKDAQLGSGRAGVRAALNASNIIIVRVFINSLMSGLIRSYFVHT